MSTPGYSLSLSLSLPFSLRKTQSQRDVEMRTQLTNRDREGMTAAMLAARSASLAVLEAILTEMEQTEASCL